MNIFRDDLPIDCAEPLSPALPFLGSLDFDGGTFHDYPARLGFSLLSSGELEQEVGCLYDAHTALLQTWLYFGLLAALSQEIGLKPDLPRLACQKELGVTIVDCAEVAIFLQKWHSHFDMMLTKDNWRSRLETVSRILAISLRNANLHDFGALDDGKSSSSKNRGKVVLGIKALVRAFYKILLPSRMIGRRGVDPKADWYGMVEDLFARAVWDHSRPATVHQKNLTYTSCVARLVERVRILHPSRIAILPPSAAVAREFLENHGWCPTLVQRLLLSEEIEMLYMAASLIAVPEEKSEHSRCNEDQGCLVARIDDPDFKPHHVETNCHCALFKPDMASVHSIIEMGGIPLIRISKGEASNWTLTVLAAEVQIDYTAISHVWTQGFADPSTNGLFGCQLSRIFQDVWQIKKRNLSYLSLRRKPAIDRWLNFMHATNHNRANDFVTIWMDALCIPCYDPENAEVSLNLKKRAINLMTPTYAGASEVLVIDKNLQTVEYDVDNEAQAKQSVISRLRLSPWMSRSWTLQEGALAQRLFVRTATCPLLLSDREPSRDGLYLGWKAGEQRLFTNVDRLARRDTSQKNDIHHILANLCLLDSSELHNLPPEKRFHALLRSQSPEFPFGVFLRDYSSKTVIHADDWWVPTCEERVHLAVEDQHCLPTMPILLESLGRTVARLENRDSEIQRGVEAILNLVRKKAMRFLLNLEDFERRSLVILQKAVLVDQGVLFNAAALKYTMVKIMTHPPQVFRLFIQGRTYWVNFDRPWSPNEALATTEAVQSPIDGKCILLLPETNSMLDAEGSIGRGLCLTTLGKPQSVPIPPTLDPYSTSNIWQATPARLDSAFTSGIITKQTSERHQHAVVVEGQVIQAIPASGSSRIANFIILADVTAWPILKNVRRTVVYRRDIAGSNLRVEMLLFYAAIVCFVGSFVLIPYLSRRFAPAIAFGVVWPLLVGYNMLYGRAVEKRTRHRQWVSTFYPLTPEARAQHASRSFKFRTQGLDVLYFVFLLDPIFQMYGSLVKGLGSIFTKSSLRQEYVQEGQV
jgi:hypothetical protein